jgi:hypothetical protein
LNEVTTLVSTCPGPGACRHWDIFMIDIYLIRN